VQELRYSKMEKADILEMTVAYLKTIYRCAPPTVPDSGTSDSTGGGRYAAGYRQCAAEVAGYLSDVASSCSSEGTVDVMQRKLIRHLTAVLQTKLLRQPDDNDQLFPVMTSFPLELEIARRSRDSSESLRADRGRTCSTASSGHSETGTDIDDVASVSPTSLDHADPTVSLSSASTSPFCLDRAMVGQWVVGWPSSVDRDGAADLDLLRARSADCCVWRPW